MNIISFIEANVELLKEKISGKISEERFDDALVIIVSLHGMLSELKNTLSQEKARLEALRIVEKMGER